MQAAQLETGRGAGGTVPTARVFLQKNGARFKFFKKKDAADEKNERFKRAGVRKKGRAAGSLDFKNASRWMNNIGKNSEIPTAAQSRRTEGERRKKL